MKLPPTPSFFARQEMVVGGYKVGEGNRTGTFGSLLVLGLVAAADTVVTLR